MKNGKFDKTVRTNEEMDFSGKMAVCMRIPPGDTITSFHIYDDIHAAVHQQVDILSAVAFATRAICSIKNNAVFDDDGDDGDAGDAGDDGVDNVDEHIICVFSSVPVNFILSRFKNPQPKFVIKVETITNKSVGGVSSRVCQAFARALKEKLDPADT